MSSVPSSPIVGPVHLPAPIEPPTARLDPSAAKPGAQIPAATLDSFEPAAAAAETSARDKPKSLLQIFRNWAQGVWIRACNALFGRGVR